jgi:iron complex transport system ATP-binding protein
VPELVVERVSVKLGSREVLSEVSLEGHAHDVLGILGPNGAGKTTLLRAILGLVPFVGSARVDGRELSKMTPLERARRVAYVPQRSALFAPLSVRHVVEQGRHMHREGFGATAQRDREAVGRAIVATDLEGIESQPFTALSRGEQRRVLIARALATEADVLLLDEPTGSLDLRHGLELVELIRQISADGRCVLVVLHALGEARQMCSRVALLAQGQLRHQGPVEQLIAPGPVREVFGVELVEGGGPCFCLGETA